MIWRLMVVMAATLAVSGAALADEAAKAVLAEAQRALKSVSAVEYDIVIEPSGAIEGNAPSVTGTLLMQAAPGLPIPVRLLGTGSIQQAGGDSTRFAASFDGEVIRSLDYELRVMQSSGIAPGADTLLVGAYDMLLDMFVTQTPLQAELGAADATLEGRVDVAGEATDVVLVTYDEDGNAGRTRFYISVEDRLPRRVDTLFLVGGREAVLTYTIARLVVNPAIDSDSFALTAPDGFVVSEFDINSMGLLPANIPAPDFTLTERTGQEVRLSDFRGKVVVLDFWATWCAPCKAAMPIIQRLHETYADRGLVIFGVITDEFDQDAALEYVDTKGYTYRQLLNGETLNEAYRIQGLPVLYLIGRDGRIVFRESGMNEAELTEAIEHALGEQDG